MDVTGGKDKEENIWIDKTAISLTPDSPKTASLNNLFAVTRDTNHPLSIIIADQVWISVENTVIFIEIKASNKTINPKPFDHVQFLSPVG